MKHARNYETNCLHKRNAVYTSLDVRYASIRLKAFIFTFGKECFLKFYNKNVSFNTDIFFLIQNTLEMEHCLSEHLCFVHFVLWILCWKIYVVRFVFTLVRKCFYWKHIVSFFAGYHLYEKLLLLLYIRIFV